MKKFILSIVSLLLFSGCFSDMDPFEGGKGVRANINGYKCVMRGEEGKVYAILNSNADGYTFRTDVRMIGMMNGIRYTLSFSLSDIAPFVTGVKYNVTGKITAARVDYFDYAVVDEDDVIETIEADVPLTGWVSFLVVSQDDHYVEALFELDRQFPDGAPYTIRHGFLRLETTG